MTRAVHRGVACRWGLAALGLCAATPCLAQPIEDLRRQLSDQLGDSGFASAFATLVASSDELELSSAHYAIDDDFDTEVSVLAFPASKVFHPWGEDEVGLYVEGVVGYGKTTQRVDDIWSGALPGGATAVSAKWRTYSGLVGLGPQFVPAEGLTLTPILTGGVAYVESDAEYFGPGAGFTSSLLDGIAFNWDGLAASWGGAGRAEWTTDLSEEVVLAVLGRYDLRWTETIETDDPAQEFSAVSQILTLRADVTGPTGIRFDDGEVGWRTTVGYRNFVQGDLEGVDNYALIGGALELRGVFPGVLSVGGAFLVGDDMTGYNVGVGLSF